MPSDQNITESFNPQGPRKDGAPSVHPNTKLPYKSKETTMTGLKLSDSNLSIVLVLYKLLVLT